MVLSLVLRLSMPWRSSELYLNQPTAPFADRQVNTTDRPADEAQGLTGQAGRGGLYAGGRE
eukprot:9486403-Pyramimonas_sp.AAC.1